MFTCEFCSDIRKNAISLSQHRVRCKSNPNRKLSGFGKVKFDAWNKGLSKDTDSRVALQANTLRVRLETGETKQSKKTPDGLRRLSEAAKANGLGGYRPHPNKGQWYGGTWFDSKWEVRVATSLDENDISWERPKSGFVWTDSGNKYYPDFYLPDFDVYLDPKNSYLRVKDAVKIAEAQIRNSIRVVVLEEHQLEWSQIKTLL